MGYGSSIKFGALTLLIDSITPTKVPHSVKQVVGQKLILREVPGSVLQDWSLIIEGRFVDTSRNTDRTTLEGYDDNTVHKLEDNIHDGDYFITSLQFSDAANRPTSFHFRMSIIQDQ